jgi:outer membrane protein assembly factor BamB
MVSVDSGDRNTSILSLAIDDDNLVAGAANGKIYAWQNDNGTFTFEKAWKANTNSKNNYKTGFISAVGLSQDKIFSTRMLPEKAVNAWDRKNNYLLLFELKGEVPCCNMPTLTHNQSSLVLSRTFSGKSLTSIPLSASSVEDAKHKDHDEHKSKVSVVESSTNHIISADESGEVYIWNQTSNLLVHHFKAHNQAIRSLKIKGSYLVTGSVTGELKIWNFPY